MKEIQLFNKNKKVIIDDDMFEFLNQWGWGTNSQGYVVRRVGSSRKSEVQIIRLHHLVLPKKEGFEIDHINRNRLDNRYENLRYATHRQNCLNTSLRKTSKSGFKGVSWSNERKKWIAQIKINGKTIRLGRYDSKEVAALVYNAKAKNAFGVFANLNTVCSPS